MAATGNLQDSYISTSTVNIRYMVKYKTLIQKFAKQGEKTGWTYFVITAAQAEKLNPGVKTSYRVKGRLDDLEIEQVAILPIGDGGFILSLNADIRRRLKKGTGAELLVQLQLDVSPVVHDTDFLECLRDDIEAERHFMSLTKGHQNYFSKWISSAKTDPTKAKRIAMAVNALSKGMGFPEMIRAEKAARQQTGF
jgi:hypothetical protein